MKKIYTLFSILTLSSFISYSQCSPCSIPFVGASQAVGNSASVTVAKPTGVVAGNVMIAGIHHGWCNNGPTVTPPLGWTLINNTSNQGTGCGSTNTTIQLATFYKVASNVEPLNYTFTGNSTNQAYVGGIVAYSNVNVVTPINASSNFGAQDLCNALVANSVTTTVTCTRLVGVWFCSVNSSATNIVPPNSMTERVDVSTTGNNPWGNENMEMADELFSTMGATGTRTAALTGCSSNGWVTGAQLIALGCNSTIGIDESTLPLAVSVSPNPSSGIFTIKMEDVTGKMANVEIYNVLGEKVYAQLVSASSTTINLSTQPKGIYFVQIKSGEIIATQKIVIE